MITLDECGASGQHSLMLSSGTYHEHATIHGHPLSEDGITCVYFAQCEANTETAIYRSVYATALETTGDAARAKRATEAYMSGRLQIRSLDR